MCPLTSFICSLSICRYHSEILHRGALGVAFADHDGGCVWLQVLVPLLNTLAFLHSDQIVHRHAPDNTLNNLLYGRQV